MGGARGPGPDVVLVDDEPRVLGVQHRLLERAGLRVRSFRCPKAALEAIVRRPPRTVVTDYHMPEMTGGQLAAALEDALGERCPPLMLVSGRATEVPAEERARFSLVVSKPIDWKLLLPTVLAWVQMAATAVAARHLREA